MVIESLKQARFITENDKEIFYVEGFTIVIGNEVRINWSGESKLIKEIHRFTDCHDKNGNPIYENDFVLYAPNTLSDFHHFSGKVVFYGGTPHISNGKINKPLRAIAGICEKKPLITSSG